VGIALVSSAADLEEGAVSVRVRGVRHAATASRKPLYDPGNARVRG
jgi:glycine cleavage system aminomethyltransferase T